ncbi:MAG: 4-hydroxythreonine-4-phosphate dehydrogenase PdxA [Geminicoccaceae bacterium]|nr:4-hydroxythreonine-4-phosphate dehydrogenase PdxA [Geminicoccaceae bacterium]
MTLRIGLLLGDATGIGPEIAAKLIAEGGWPDEVQVVVIGDAAVLKRGASAAGVQFDLPVVERLDGTAGPAVLLEGPAVDLEQAPVGQVSREAGRAAMATFELAAALIKDGTLDALTYAPLNKQALHDAGMTFEDDLRFFVHLLKFEGNVGEINATDQLATTRVTSHVPLKEVAGLITEDSVLQAIRLAHETLRAAGNPHPRIGVAGLNPHAGDGGIFGREEIEVIGPAVERSKREQIAAAGPYPSDTVFIRARDGAFDGVVTMYHDQGQIAMKLMGFERGVTILGGLPVPVTTAAHGTAHDIAGKGIARPDALRQALQTAYTMAQGAQA